MLKKNYPYIINQNQAPKSKFKALFELLSRVIIAKSDEELFRNKNPGQDLNPNNFLNELIKGFTYS